MLALMLNPCRYPKPSVMELEIETSLTWKWRKTEIKPKSPSPNWKLKTSFHFLKKLGIKILSHHKVGDWNQSFKEGYKLELRVTPRTRELANTPLYLFHPIVGLEINWVSSNLESNNGTNTQYLFHPLSWIRNQLGGLQFRKQQWY
jgi:hypothetical protein